MSMMIQRMTAFIKENPFPNEESCPGVIQTCNGCNSSDETAQNNCYNTTKSISSQNMRGRNRTGLTIMFVASYLLIFTVVTSSFVTSLPVTNLRQQQAELKLVGKTETTMMPTLTLFSSPSSLFSPSESPGTDAGKETHSEKHGMKNQHNNLSPAQPLSLPFVQQQLGDLEKEDKNEVELSNQFENEIGSTRRAAGVLKASSVHSYPGNVNVSPLTMTNTLRNKSTSTNATVSDKQEDGSKEKVGLVADKNKVMLTDDVKRSASTVNPVSSASSSSTSSISSQNGNSPPPSGAHSSDGGDDVDKAGVADDENGRTSGKVNIIPGTEETRMGITLKEQQQQRQNLKGNLIVSQSQRFMSTAAVTEKLEREMTLTTITTPMNRELDEGAAENEDYYRTSTSRYANVVNNHVNFGQEKEKWRRQEKQKGLFDTDYRNKTSASTPAPVKVGNESQSGDKDNVASAPGNGKSSFPSTTDSSSTSSGNLMKSTQRRSSPATEMNSISLSPVPLAGAADKKENNENEKRSHFATGENSKEAKQDEEYNAHNQKQHKSPHHYYSYDYSDDLPVTPLLLTGEDGNSETNEDENPPSQLSSATAPLPSSTSSSPLLMNKWIKTLVKLSQCRANCLDQAGIHYWDSASLVEGNLLEQEQKKREGNDAVDNQEEEGATGGAPFTLPFTEAFTTAASTPIWSDLEKEEKPKTRLVYTGQMKKSSSNPLVPPFPSTTPERTIKVTPGKSMKYYELSNCQQLCRRKFSLRPIHPDDHFTIFSHTIPEASTTKNVNGEKEDIMNNGSSTNPNTTFARNKGNESNGPHNSNTDDNNNNENIEFGGRRNGVVAATDRKGNNNHHHSHRLVEEQEYRQQQHYYNLLSSSTATPSGKVGEAAASKAFGGSNDLTLMKKLLAIEQNSEENTNKQGVEHEHSQKTGTTVVPGSLNNLEAFPSEPGLKVRQLSLRKEKDKNDGDDASAFSPSSAFPVFQLSWPQPGSRENGKDVDDVSDDNNRSNKPEGSSAQVKDEKGIHPESTGTAEKKNAQRPQATVVYSIILEEWWNEADGFPNCTVGQRRWKLIDQTVARTTTQISLPLLPISSQGTEKKVQSEQKNNKKETMGLAEQNKGISKGKEAGALGKVVIKGNVEGVKSIKPASQHYASHMYDNQREKNKAPFSRRTDPPSKVTLRVLAVSREGIEKVYSAQVKVNNSFWDYHLNEHENETHSGGLTVEQVYREKEENLNQDQADEGKTRTQADANTTPGSHNNREREESSSASPVEEVAVTAKFFDNDEKTGNQKKSGGEQIERVGDKFKEKAKVAEEKKGRGTEKDEDAAVAVDFNGSNENSNKILVFPSAESLRQTLGAGRGLSGEMKVKKLMTRLKQKKKKSENEVENGYHPYFDQHFNKLITGATLPTSRKPEEKFAEKRGKEKGDQKSSNQTSNKVKLKFENETKSEPTEASTDETPTQYWGLHTVSMIHQKFLVVTQVSWDYPGSDATATTAPELQTENNEKAMSSSNNANNNANNKTGAIVVEKDAKIPSSSNKKWKGCGSRASNSNSGSGVDTGGKNKEQEEEQQLNFLLSWEIFGGGLRGNLVTDTCSASISLWPDTAYIIQVGLITPNIVDASSLGMTQTNVEDSTSSYAAYLAAWKEKTRQFTEQGNIPSNHVPRVSNYADENSGHEHAVHDQAATWPLGKVENVEISSLSLSPSMTSSYFDPLILPESITFPFDGEPKVTIKSERILVNTTQDRSTSKEEDNDDLAGKIHNQDKMTPGNSQSNNNFLSAEKKRNGAEEEQGDNDEETAVYTIFKKNFGGGSGRNDGTGFNDKVNVSPITISSTRNGRLENEPGPAFEEEEADQNLLLHLQQQQDQPEAESLLPAASLSSLLSRRQEKVGETAARAVNEDAASADQENSSVWSDEDENEATDQDESLFARSLAHQNHHLQHHSAIKNNNSNINNGLPPPKFRSMSLPQPHTQPAEDVEQQPNVPEKTLGSKFHSFMTVKSFYQSLYQSLSRNALELSSHRYPNVITITGTNEGNGGGAGSNKRVNGSSAESLTSGHGGAGDPNIGPLLIGEFGSSNRSGYLFSTTHTGGDDDSSGYKGKLYTLFVILVISFVIFLFIVAIVGFCVLTNSIKENYKYFVPKKVRVWTTVGQLIKGPNNGGDQAGTSSSGGNGVGASGGGLPFKDSAEGSFYPRRLQEEPDFEDFEDDNEDFDPDEDEEEISSVEETDDEDEADSECDCHCGIVENAIVEVEEEENSFSLNERCSSDRVKLIRDGEENSVELIAAVDDEDEEEELIESHNGDGIGETSYSSSGITNSNNNRCRGSHHHRGNSDNNNPCYHTAPGAGARLFQQHTSVKASPVAAALSSLRKNFHRVSSSASASSASKQQSHHLHQTPRHNHNNRHHPHCHLYHQQHKRKSDTRIDATGGNSRTRNIASQRQDGYY